MSKQGGKFGPGSREFEALPWPENVPILTAKDFCKNASSRGRCKDFGQWVDDVFVDIGHIGTNVLYSMADKMAVKASKGTCKVMTEYNDLPSTTGDDLAALWLELLKRLGYDLDD